MSDSSLIPTHSDKDISPVQENINKYDVTDSMRSTSVGSSEDADSTRVIPPTLPIHLPPLPRLPFTQNTPAEPRSPSTDSAVDQFKDPIMGWSQEISEMEKAMFKEQDPYLREHYTACIKRREEWIRNK
ncbi:hypothetical protein BGZ76_000154 [Entomortierella beljakovae]|nr:hypothetical protein BGZ76_000154 [Entomortierella beljakovae]